MSDHSHRLQTCMHFKVREVFAVNQDPGYSNDFTTFMFIRSYSGETSGGFT